MLYCTYLLDMFRALIRPSSRARDYTCVTAAYGVRCVGCWWSAVRSRPPATKAFHTVCCNNTSIVSTSWCWAYKCLKHAEQIISAIKHSVASSWFSFLCLYYDARTNIHQMNMISSERLRPADGHKFLLLFLIIMWSFVLMNFSVSLDITHTHTHKHTCM